MISLDTILAFLTHHGLWLVAILATLEGPIVTVLAAFLLHQGVFELVPLAVVLMLADIAGDLGYYGLGRYGLSRVAQKWRNRMGLSQSRLETLTRHFDAHGGRTLLFGKVTHSAGAAILVSAGVARMPIASFIFYNVLGTVPKTAFFMALGYFAGGAYAQIDLWIGRGSWIILALLLSLGLIWFLWRRQCLKE